MKMTLRDLKCKPTDFTFGPKSFDVMFELLKYYSPMNTHGKTFVYDFCVL